MRFFRARGSAPLVLREGDQVFALDELRAGRVVAVERDAPRAEPDVLRVLLVLFGQAMIITSTLWLDAVVETLREQPDAEREQRFLRAAHLIEATFALGPRERHDAVRHVADCLVPIT